MKRSIRPNVDCLPNALSGLGGRRIGLPAWTDPPGVVLICYKYMYNYNYRLQQS